MKTHIIKPVGRYCILLLSVFILATVISSCNHDSDDPEPVTTADHTIFMYMPWAASLKTYIDDNVSDIKTAIVNNGGLGNDKFVIFTYSNSTTAYLIEIKYENGKCVNDTLKKYSSPAITTSSGLTSIFNDVKTETPGKSYSMIIGCHSIGWVSKTAWSNFEKGNTSAKQFGSSQGGRKFYLTRSYGGDSNDYRAETSTLVDGIKGAGIKMQYILFDDCYMANMESAYQMRDVTNYLIGSTCEIMAYGMPYLTVWKYLVGTPDYNAVCTQFYKFYSTYEAPYGTLAVINCNEAENMAAVMKNINSQCAKCDSTDDIQKLDGFTTTVYFDMGDYVKHLCNGNTSLYSSFETELAKLVPYSVHTSEYYSIFYHTSTSGTNVINSFSGVTISDPSTNSSIKSDIPNTEWYIASH